MLNIKFSDGTIFHIPTNEHHGTMVAIVEEFLDQCETHPQGADFRNLGVRFLDWYAGNTDLGIRVGAGLAESTVVIEQKGTTRPAVR